MRNTPTLYIGAPGTGKTAIIKSQYDHCEILLMSSQVEEDIAGIPYREGPCEKRTIPPWLQRINEAHAEGKTNCLFLDELDKARREVADTILTLVVSPEYFGVPETTDIVAAGNPPEWGGGDGISDPMLSRFAVLDYTPDFNQWLEYMQNKYKNPIVDRIMDGFASYDVPFLEVVGEGYKRRLTCPRTIDASIQCFLNKEKDWKNKIRGLLTTNVSSFILSFEESSDNKETKAVATQMIARKIASSSRDKSIQPIRI